VKFQPGSGAALALLAPMVLLLALVVIPVGCGGGGGSSATPTPTGMVEVGLVDSSSSSYQNLLLNVLALRINPSGDLHISKSDPNWVPIRVSRGLTTHGELQIDLANLQDQVQLFATQPVLAQQYRQVELELDFTDPGQIVPNCPQAPSPNEGCLSYPLALESQKPIRAKVSLDVVNGQFAPPLIVDIDPGTITPPAGSGGVYTIDPSISVATGADYLGRLHGSVANVPTQGAEIRAELRGTGQLAGSAAVVSGSYSLQLPAQAPSAGTLYDVFVRGTGVEFSAASGIAITRGGSVSRDFTVVSAAQDGLINGHITDKNTGSGIQGATINLLVPPDGEDTDCSKKPADCVIVAVANTGINGYYPQSGNIFNPTFFNTVPLGTYTLQVIAGGYDSFIASAPVITNGVSAICGSSNSSTLDCSFALTSTTVSGTVSIDAPPAAGAEVQVLVMGEDSGTNNLENVTMVTIPSGQISAPFTLAVPTKVASFDLFAAAQDFYNGRIDPFPGHTIEVLSNVAGGATGQDFPALNCVGHGTLTGEVAVTPDSGTTVRLSKNNVQLMESQVGPSTTTNAGQFSFCAPPDTYSAQRYESGVPASAPTTVTIPEPAATSTPCPICSLGDGSCPGVCTSTPLINPL
jgi:uncharacterized protein DUF4382